MDTIANTSNSDALALLFASAMVAFYYTAHY